jgi:hypothetical protein
MLRRWVMGFGILLLGLAVLLWLTGCRGGAVAPLFVWGIILAGGIAIERFAYKPELDRPPGPGWVRTEEKSVDARGVVTVWFNPATGERAYVRAPAEGPA